MTLDLSKTAPDISEWLISETMRDDPSLTREQAIALIRQAEAEAAAGGL